jgi:hypothetical protein
MDLKILKMLESFSFSKKTASDTNFQSIVCNSDWDRFIEEWAGKIYSFVGEVYVGYHTKPRSLILPMGDAMHSGGANASFNIDTGQTSLCPSIVENKPGTTLEKLTHEFTHGALAGFPEGDPFYEEGFVDYSVWVLAHAPIWGEHREAMIEAADYNIKCRRERALKDFSDYDRKRWAGGLFAATAHGPWLVSRLRMRKLENNLNW